MFLAFVSLLVGKTSEHFYQRPCTRNNLGNCPWMRLCVVSLRHPLMQKSISFYYLRKNRPFAPSGHMVWNKLCWVASYRVGLSKQRKLGLTSTISFCNQLLLAEWDILRSADSIRHVQLYSLFFFFLFPISFICPVLSFNDIIFVICEHYIEEGESKAPAFVLFFCLFVFSPAGFFCV